MHSFPGKPVVSVNLFDHCDLIGVIYHLFSNKTFPSKGMPSVLSGQSASVAYVTPWRQVPEAHDGQMVICNGDGFVTPPMADHSRSNSLSSSEDSTGKWDSLVRAKDGLICQKDQIIDRFVELKIEITYS